MTAPGRMARGAGGRRNGLEKGFRGGGTASGRKRERCCVGGLERQELGLGRVLVAPLPGPRAAQTQPKAREDPACSLPARLPPQLS